MKLLLFLLNIQFCNQRIDINTQILQCNRKIAIKEFEKLKKFKKLEILDLSNSNFNDIRHIKNLKELKCLSLENTKIQNLKGIGALNKLIELDIRTKNNLNYENLKNLKNLKILYLNYINNKLLNNLNYYLKKIILLRTKKELYSTDIISKINRFNYVFTKYSGFILLKIFDDLSKKDINFPITVNEFIKDKNIFYLINNQYILNMNLYLIAIKYLINKKININIIDNNFKSPLDHALVYKDKKLLTLLKRYGALRANNIIIKKEKEKLLNHYLKGKGKSYHLEGTYWKQVFKNKKYIKDFETYVYKYSKNNISLGDRININIGKINRSCICENNNCTLEFHIYSNLELLNKHENLNLKLKNGNNFQIVYKFRSKDFYSCVYSQ